MHANVCAGFDLKSQLRYITPRGREAPPWAPVLSPEAMGPLDYASRPPLGWLPLRERCSSSGARGAPRRLSDSPLLSSKTQVSSWPPRSHSESPDHSSGAPRTTPGRRACLLQPSVPPLPTPADLLAPSSRPRWVSPWVPLGPDIFFLSPCILAAPARVLFQFSCLVGCPPWENPYVQRGQSWWPFRRHVPLQSADAALFGKRVFVDEIKVRISRLKHFG